MPDNNLELSKQELIAELDRRIEDKIIERSNADLLKKLILNADTLTEAVAIAELGTTYKRTGFHFDKRLERFGDTIKYLKKNEELSFITDNSKLTHKLIIGDNYDALLNLLIEYKGGIDVIYIDPPYGMNNMGEFAKTNYNNAITRDNLLSMLYTRLTLARLLLNDSGVIFCSIDDKNQAYVKCLFDEIFGEKNFIACLVWEKKKKGAFLSNHYINMKEYILVYAKYSNYFPGMIGEINTNEETYPCIKQTNARGIRIIRKGTVCKHKNKNIKLEANTRISAGNMELIYLDELLIEEGVLKDDVKIDSNWIYSQDKLDEYYRNNQLYITQDLYIRRIVTDNRVKKLRDLLLRVGPDKQSLPDYTYDTKLHNGGWGTNEDANDELHQILGTQNLFDYLKPVRLIAKLIQSVSMKNDDETNKDIILDFFAGTGTTGHAVLELNKQDGGQRTFILATNNEKIDTAENGIAYDLSSKRLRRIMTGKCYDGTSDFEWNTKNEPLGDNLCVYDIASVSNFETSEGNTSFDVIDETLYGQPRLNTNDKIKWVCENFDDTQRTVESDSIYMRRIGG